MPVAPLGDLQIGRRGGGAPTRKASGRREKIRVRQLADRPGRPRIGDGRHDTMESPGAQKAVHLGQGRNDFLAKALGQAPHHYQAPAAALLLEFGQPENRVDGFIHRRPNETAGVDHDGIGGGRVVDNPPAGSRKATEHGFTVHLVAGAAKAHEVHGAGRHTNLL